MLLLQFTALQILDALTTLWFLRHGIAEANPLLRWEFGWCPQPGLALALAKSFSLLPAVWAWHSGRHGVLRKVNLVFLGCVAWNLIALGVSSWSTPIR